MAAEGSLKRLGGGRWETRDGRFAIEPQSGTWVVVDNTQTDDLGLPLVRGPFGSLTAAKEAIENARDAGPAESPLADRIKQARSRPRPDPGDRGSARRGAGDKATPSTRRTGTKEPDGTSARTEAEPPPPPEPKWLRDLGPADRRKARELIERLGSLGIDDPEPIARAEIVRDEPALTRLALERVISAAVASARTPGGAGRAVVKAIMGGRDPELGVRWRLVDERGRHVDGVDAPD
jgi:hypothetical protein